MPHKISAKSVTVRLKPALNISVDSPIGQGLLGKKVGEVAEIQVPNGTMKFEVIEISRV